jgi:regulator of protease activity HflC (stomatin/prohibitin superfamily)
MKTRIVILIVVVLLALMLVAPLAALDEDTSARGYTFQKYEYTLGARGFYKVPWIIGWWRGFSAYAMLW